MNNMNSKVKSQQLVKMAMMAALACVVGLIRFPLIPAVSFLTYDFADIPILITDLPPACWCWVSSASFRRS